MDSGAYRLNQLSQKLSDLKAQCIDFQNWSYTAPSQKLKGQIAQAEEAIRTESNRLLSQELARIQSTSRFHMPTSKESKLKKVPSTSNSSAPPKLVVQRALSESEKRNVETFQRNKERCDSTDLLKKNKDGTYGVLLKQDLPHSDGFKESQSRWFQTTGLVDSKTGADLLTYMEGALSPDESRSDYDFEKQINRIGRMMREFQPADAIESALCAQIVVCQTKGLETLKQAGFQKSSPEWSRTLHNSGSKLLARAQAAIQQLISYRRAGQQKIVVEHVNMAPGSQAAFGTFECTPGVGGVNKKSVRGTL